MNPIHTIPNCPTLGAADCIGTAVKRAAAGAEKVVALTAATDHPCGVVKGVADDNKSVDVALPGSKDTPVRLAADCEELDYLFIDANGKFAPAANGVRFAQASEGGKAGALIHAYILPPLTIA